MAAIKIRTAGLDAFMNETVLPSDSGMPFSFLILGPSGAGKTPFAAQFPKPFFIMADRNGPTSLMLTPTVPYSMVENEVEAIAVIDHLDTELRKAGVGPKPYETIVLDTGSVLQTRILQGLLKKRGLDSFDDFRDWGTLTAKFEKVINRLHNLNKYGVNIVVNIHVKDKFDDSKDGKVKAKALEAALMGGAKDSVFREFSFVGSLESEWIVKQGPPIAKGKPVETKVNQRFVRWHATPGMPNLRSASNLLPEKTLVNFTPEDYLVIWHTVRDAAKALGTRAAVIGEIAAPADDVAAPDATSGAVAPRATSLPKPRTAAAPRAAAAGKVAAAKKESAATAAKVAAVTGEAPAAAADPSTWKAPETPASEEQPATAQPPVEAPAAEPAVEPEAQEPVGAAVVAEVLGGEVISDVETPDDESTAVLALIAEAANPAALVTLWRNNRAVWGEEHTAAATARTAELDAS